MRINILAFDGQGKESKDFKAVERAFVNYYEGDAFLGEIILIRPSLQELNEEYLLNLFEKLTEQPSEQGSREVKKEDKDQTWLLKDGDWVTINGRHVFIGEGENAELALHGPKLNIVPHPDVGTKYYGLEGGKGGASVSLNWGGRGIEEGSAEIELLEVEKEERGKGYGRYIVNRVEADLRNKEGVKTVYVKAVPSAVPFWDKMGYKPYLRKPDVSGLSPESAQAKLDIWEGRRKKELGKLGKAEGDDWCTSQGGQWITAEGRHICIDEGTELENGKREQRIFHGEGKSTRLITSPNIPEGLKDRVLKEISYMPDRFVSNLKGVELSTDDMTLGKLFGGEIPSEFKGLSEGAVKGSFDSNGIHIYREGDYKTFSHEFGHQIFRNLSPDESATWGGLYGKNKTGISDYARVSPSEGFAEWWSQKRTTGKSWPSEMDDFYSQVMKGNK